ncbi:MAG: SDR family NAD(P)-dependent oxidoreductase [Pseudomonadales bacterium]
MKRTVLISGCGGALGLEIAEKYLKAGDRVIGTVRRDDDRAAVCNTLESPRNLSLYSLDLSLGRLATRQIATIVSDSPNVDVLINNAATHYPATIEDADIDRCRQLFEVNLWSPVLLAQAVLPRMRARKRGYIINIGSLSGLAGLPCDGIYGASKAAMRAVFESLRQEVASFNVNVSMVVCGSFQSGLQGKMISTEISAGSVYEDLYQSWLESMQGSESSELSASDVAASVFRISECDTPDFFYPVGRVAKEVLAALEKMSDAERQAAIRRWSG